MAGPGQVRFPGEDKRRKLRMKGIKKASDSIQKRLRKNLDALLDDPSSILPTRHPKGVFPRRDPLKKTQKEVQRVTDKRNNLKWLQRRMRKRRGDVPARALAGTLAAAHEETFDTVSIFQNPAYGRHSFVRRGMAAPTDLASMQNFHDIPLRLLLWRDHAKAGIWFFGSRAEIVCTGTKPLIPDGWIDEGLKQTPINLQKDGRVWFTSGLTPKEVEERKQTKDGWIRFEFNDGTLLGISAASLQSIEESLIGGISLRMLPPKISAVAEIEWIWAPEGWGDDREISKEMEEAGQEVLTAWTDLTLKDKDVVERLKGAVTNSIDEGFVLGTMWFEEFEEGISAIEGTDLEKEAIQCALSNIKAGLHVRRDGVALDSPDDVIRLEMRAGHDILISLWDDWGHTILEEMFGIEGEKADDIHAKQMKRKQGFNAFLKGLSKDRQATSKLEALPWNNTVLPSPLDLLHDLVRKGHTDGLGRTISMVRKRKVINDAAMGWAWLVAHDRDGSEAWRFEQVARDKGGDWARAVSDLWQVSEILIAGNGKKSDYIDAMGKVAAAASLQTDLPDDE